MKSEKYRKQLEHYKELLNILDHKNFDYIPCGDFYMRVEKAHKEIVSKDERELINQVL